MSFYLSSIVESYVPTRLTKVDEALAVSLRFDGSIERMQLDNENVMAHIVTESGEDELIFLGFNEPPERGAGGSLKAIKVVVEQTLSWDTIFNKTSSLASDGENKHAGIKIGLCAKLDMIRRNSGSQLPLLKLWCAYYKSDLASVSVTKNVPEVQKEIRKATAVSTFFTNMAQDGNVAEENDLYLLRLPSLFEVRWTQYTDQLFQNIISSLLCNNDVMESTEPHEQGFFDKLKDYGQTKRQTYIFLMVVGGNTKCQKICKS